MITNKSVRVGIVVEYNPFHNGHIYQLNWIKKQFPNSQIIVAMSHKYSQRGEFISVPWKTRVKYAKRYGVSKFIKLNVDISAQAAHIFARESVLKLAKAKIDYLVFGSETNDVNLFITIAQLLKNNKEQYNVLVKKYLKQKGLSFPRATNLALQELSQQDINMPNDILGLEYVKTIVNENLKIIPVSLERTIGFRDTKTSNQFASATYIRQLHAQNQDISQFTPIKKDEFSNKRIENTYSKFQKQISKTPAHKLAKYQMISEGMENLFKKQINQPNYQSFIDACTSRRYTNARIKRTYLFVFLKIKSKSWLSKFLNKFR
ncbi:nucleotidyltransferase [Mycoplasmopsis sturni]|uniref:nucleotidyltransferase n=1 Tax=Mycoplasmopsis sturni TaxID=39047 RepID=UPI00068C6E14|nr:nucleotidyltransferase [Mycoplasmopsis sturni]